jgi:uncharacterized membrane protein SpoIIM required for sporulation
VEEREFVAGSRAAWERLAASVGAARESGVSKLDAGSLRQMHEDYRRAAADLAYAQTHFTGSETTEHLNRLVGQAHGELYGSAPRRLAAIWRFLSRGYPVLLRASWRHLVLSAAILCGAAGIGYVLAHVDYPLARLLLPEQFRDGIADSAGASGDREVSLVAPAFSALIGINNVRVALVAFAGGMTAGLLTVFSLLQNGAMLGVLAGVFAKAGSALEFWSLIVPHGALELPAIVIAGAAGLMLAEAIVLPGDLPRTSALKTAAPDAVRLVLGTLPMFAIAAVIEGFFTPRAIDPVVKLATGGIAAALLAAYWGLAGRERSRS